MGNLWSQPQRYLDGLQFPSTIEPHGDTTKAADKLEQLLRASINSYRLSSIAPPITAAFYLGAEAHELTNLYEKWVPQLCKDWPEDDPVADSIGKFNLDEWFGDDRYEQRYYEYFRDCLTEEPNWDRMAASHMDQVWNRLCRNNFRPLIELAAGVEADNGMIVSEALAMSCTDPEGDVAIAELGPPNVEPELARRLRELSRSALAQKSYTAVVAVHACAEIFLKPGLPLLSTQRELAMLQSLTEFLPQIRDTHAVKTVDPQTALESEDPYLITYTRSRLVLEILAR